jgi:2-oxo-4-hydroxy-4-carboxy-5-ureidoimidazoline decarboxylase
VSIPDERLSWLNSLPEAQARRELLTCCTSPTWVEGVSAGRPYPSIDALLISSNKVVASLSVDDLRAALDGHPRIGDRPAGDHGNPEWSRREQAGVAGSDDAVQRGLAEGNLAYERQFGHIYLVCAAGRSGAELLAVLRDRLGNDPQTEWDVVRAELGKINALRLAKLLGA